MQVEISVVIPAFNKRTALMRALTGFAQQDLAAERFEVIVVDDGSTDGTKDHIATMASAANLRYRRQENRGRSAARNLGLTMTQAPIVIFCDADCIPAPNFVRAHLERHAQARDRVVNGGKFDVLAEWQKTPRLAAQAAALLPALDADALRARVDATPPGEVVAFFSPADIQRDFGVVQRHLLAAARHNWTAIYEEYSTDLRGFSVPWVTFVTQNVSVHRDLLERAGFFDETFVGWGFEDSELGLRLQLQGAHYLYEESAATFHQIHPGPLAGSVARQYWAEFARNYERLLDKHPRLDVYLHWRLICGLLSIKTYHELVVRHASSGDSVVNADYLRVCEHLARQLCRVKNPSPRSFLEIGIPSETPQTDPVDAATEPGWPLDT